VATPLETSVSPPFIVLRGCWCLHRKTRALSVPVAWPSVCDLKHRIARELMPAFGRFYFHQVPLNTTVGAAEAGPRGNEQSIDRILGATASKDALGDHPKTVQSVTGLLKIRVLRAATGVSAVLFALPPGSH